MIESSVLVKRYTLYLDDFLKYLFGIGIEHRDRDSQKKNDLSCLPISADKTGISQKKSAVIFYIRYVHTDHEILNLITDGMVQPEEDGKIG